MLRFPNPGSDIDNFVAVFNATFEQLYGQVFDLDSMVDAVVRENLATSSGYMGSEAIARSTRADRSRDPLYNQLKMYSELFRALGWIHPTEQSALNFAFTLLGRQVIAAGQHYMPLLEETVLGIAYPSHVLGVRGTHVQRPFAFLLLTMLGCEDVITRDEMIVGPLSAQSDRNENAVADVAALIQTMRTEPEAIRTALVQVATQQQVQVNTLRNYTRWPIAVMRDLGWTQKGRLKFRQGTRSFEVHQLTERGKHIAEWVQGASDIRLDQIEVRSEEEGQSSLFDQMGEDHGEENKLSPEEMAAVSVHAHYRMLERAGFDLQSVEPMLGGHAEFLSQALAKLELPSDRPLLFSPFQSLSISDIARVFAPPEISAGMENVEGIQGGTVVGRDPRDHLFVEPAFVIQRDKGENRGTDNLAEELHAIRGVSGSIDEAAMVFAKSRESDTQNEFYPLVSGLFRLLGFEADNSRAGVNYQRLDAWVYLEGDMTPVEIKSPREELFLSTKAVRQALENKVILLSRGEGTPRFDTTSLIVGYQIPNERGDMATLINDIFDTFNINIGVIDIRTLASLAIRAVTEDLTVRSDQIRTLRGFLHV